jgi:pimeloyl-ACP methyl ester carboxylesterase
MLRPALVCRRGCFRNSMKIMLGRRLFTVAFAATLLFSQFALLTCFASAEAAPVNHSGFVMIGGIEQWIGVTGDDRSNPIILVVHGGPGEAQWPQAARYKPWKKEFTVAQWDQRGAGRTYGRYTTQTPNVNLTQIVSDGIEVAEYLCHTYGKRKIVLLGHSWGSIVAVNMVKQRPDLFAAYVGTGQVASWADSVQWQFDLLLAKARADHDSANLKMLEAIGKPDPKNAQQYFAFSKNLFAVMAPSDQAWLKGLRTAMPNSLGISREDYKNLLDGMGFSSERVLADQIATDLPRTAADIQAAFFLIQGRDDVVTPTSAAVNYFRFVKAPKKELVLVDGGHFAFMTDGKQFLNALVQQVRPVAIRRGA